MKQLIIVLLLAFSLAACEDNGVSTQDPTNTNGNPTNVDVVYEPFEVELTAGHYVAGTDIPAGVYTITAVSGYGNVHSSNMFSGGLNEIMSDEEEEYIVNEFKNAKLEKDVRLSVSSDLVIHITSEKAEVSTMTSRSQSGLVEVELSSGNYVAGNDFAVGIYDIVHVSGSMGNVSSSNMFDGGINEILGPGNDNFTIKEFKNAHFEENDELSVSGITIKLIPSN